MSVAFLEELETYVTSIRRSLPKIGPGNPFRFSEASSLNDRVWQGDLGITITNTIPADFVKVDKVTNKHLQLVPGNTIGSKHCLTTSVGVELWVPPVFNDESLIGPCIKCLQDTSIEHPTHGTVTIPAGFMIQCTYQRNLDQIQKVEIRARD